MTKIQRNLLKGLKGAGIMAIPCKSYTPTKEDKVRAKEISEFLKKIDRAEKASRKSKLKFTVGC